MTRAWRAVGGSVLVLGLMGGWFSPTGGAEVPSKLLKPEAWLYLEAREPKVLVDRWESGWVQSLLKTPALAKAWDSPQWKQLRDVLDLVSAQLGTTSDDSLRKLLGGGVVVAMEPGGAEGFQVFGIVTAADGGYLERFHTTLLELARGDAAGKGNPDPVNEFQHGNVACYSVSPGEAHAIVDGRLWIANGREALESILARREQPPASSLEGDARFQAARRSRGEQATIWVFGRLGPLRDLQAARDKQEGKSAKPSDPNAVLLLGPWLMALERAPVGAAGLNWGEDKLDLAVELDWPEGAGGEPFRGFVPPEGQGAPELILTQRGIATFGLWRDWSSVWDQRARLLPPEAVQNLAQLDTTAGTFFGGRDFGTGVLGAVGKSWRLVISHQDYEKQNPQPDLKLPGFALVFDVDPADEEFATRLEAAFQSFIGLANLDSAQKKAAPLLLSSVEVEGVTIATARYTRSRGKGEAAAGAGADGPVPDQYNFTPSAALVDHSFILSTSIDLARDLVRAFKGRSVVKGDAGGRGPTLHGEVSGPALAQLVALNRERLIGQNMLEKGNDRASAEAAIGMLEQLLNLAERGRITVTDRPDAMELRMDVRMKPTKP